VNEKTQWQDMVESYGSIALILAIIFVFLIMSAYEPEPQPAVIPTPTQEPLVNVTESLTPTPEPTPTVSLEMQTKLRGGYLINEWHQWYREDVSGQQDMIIRATVYDYRIMPYYRWLDFSWGSRATRKETSYPGNVFLFVFVRTENIGTSDLVYGFGKDHFVVQVNQTTYAPNDETDPSRKIKELENLWTRDHVETPPPYGYKQVQELGTGIISAEYLEWLQTGQPWDGYIIYEIPADTKPEDIKVLGRFDNLGGNVWWQLK
jgi:hypothetical protein